MTRRLILFAAVVSLLLFAAAQAFLFDFSGVVSIPKTEVSVAQNEPPAPVIYGIVTDSLEVRKGVVEPGETISTLLGDYNIGLSRVHALSEKAKDVYDLRRMRAKRPYTLLYARDASRTARYFIYEPNATEYVIYDLRDSLCVTLCQRRVDVVEREIIGQIRGSLYKSILNAGGSARLVDQLADIYAWRLDLNRVQPGDSFKLIFESRQIDGKTIADGQLKGAYIQHSGEPLYAIALDQGKGVTYFDQDGKSFKKAFLKEPVEFSRISSRYTQRRFHPVQRRFKPHLGTDYAARRGTPIRTVGDGVVVEASRSRGNGNYVKIRHDKTYTTQYLHMSKFAKGIRRGARVSMGQTIGYVGSTGLSTGPHLCYRFWKNGQQVDALKVKLPLAEPVREEYQDVFLAKKDSIIERMEAMDARQTRADLLAAHEAKSGQSSI
ncbi:peptidoglycan DD-metalloendopeptidase family protein [Persicitalea sp.]|uniref:peptidoglycan DD-metalloendopeptidase family protein n=1 Tax=Persicitalea sp. TaxID=3100273 RepID=UPI003593AA6C